MSDGNRYNDNDTVGNAFSEPSTFDHPVVRQGANVPGMPFTNAPDCAYGGFGTGGETIEQDGSITTRHKGESEITSGGGVDGGAP